MPPIALGVVLLGLLAQGLSWPLARVEQGYPSAMAAFTGLELVPQLLAAGPPPW